MRNETEPVVLSAGHAGLALYCVLEAYEKKDAEKLFEKHGTHPNRDIENGIYASTGSLGHGVGIALGMALTNKDRNVYCLVSDGEMAEGSVWETLRIAADHQVSNLIIIVNANGWGAYREIYKDRLEWQVASFINGNCPKISFITTTLKNYPEWLHGQAGHYVVMNDEQYQEITRSN